MTIKRLMKKIVPVFMSLALFAACLGSNTEAYAASVSVYGTKPSSKKVTYDLSSSSYLPKTVVFSGSVITSKPVNTEENVNSIGCPDKNCPFFKGKVYHRSNGLKFVGDVSSVSAKNEKVEYYVIESGKKTLKTKTVAKEATVSAGPVLVYGEKGSEFIQTDVKCSHGFVGETYYNTFNSPVRVEALGADYFKVKYDLAGGVLPGGAKNETAFYFSNKNYSYEYTAPVKLGSTFDSWKTPADGLLWSVGDELVIAQLDSVSWSAAKKMVASGTTKATAVWRDAEIKITLDFGYDGKENEIFRYKGSDLNAEIDYTPERKGYDFKGWYLGETKITVLNDIPKAAWNDSNEYTLTAKWEKGEEPAATPAPEVTKTPDQPKRPDAMPDPAKYSNLVVVAPDFSDSDPLFDSHSSSSKSVGGLEYKPSENVLKIDGYNGSAVFAEAMGSSFTVEISGTNTMTQLYSLSGEYNASVTISGTGTLNLTGTDSKEGLLVRAQGTDTQLVIEDGVNLNIGAGSGKSAVRVVDSSNPEPIKIGANEDLNGAKIVVVETSGEDGETLYTAEIKSQDVKITHKKPAVKEETPKAGKTSVSKLASSKAKSLTVTLKKTEADGYQIRYSLNKNMSKSKTASSTSNKKTISKLKSGKKYYVQVRAYVLDENGKKIYSAWSAKKSIKVK